MVALKYSIPCKSGLCAKRVFHKNVATVIVATVAITVDSNILCNIGEKIYLQNLITINLINMKKKDDPLTIFLVLSEIKEQMKDHEKGLLKNAWLCFEKYLELAIVSLFISYYADSKFTDYKRFLLEMSKNFYQQKRPS